MQPQPLRPKRLRTITVPNQIAKIILCHHKKQILEGKGSDYELTEEDLAGIGPESSGKKNSGVNRQSTDYKYRGVCANRPES